MPDVPFAFDLKQRNTLKVSGLAAYVQRPPPDRVGWVHARHVWLPDWRPEKWAYEVQHLEVTFASYEQWKHLEAEQRGHEPLEILMVTRHSTFLSDDLGTVEAFFARFTDRPEWAQHPDKVGCPHEYVGERRSNESPARWSLVRRAFVARLLDFQASGVTFVWDTPRRRLEGRVTAVHFHSFVLSTKAGEVQFSFADRWAARVYQVEEDGYVRALWQEPTGRMALDPSTLPVWEDASECWVTPDA